LYQGISRHAYLVVSTTTRVECFNAWVWGVTVSGIAD
jgi:hypothetical protein